MIGAAALAGALLCEKKSTVRQLRPTFDCTDEMILAQPYFDILVAASENRGIPCDIVSYSLGDGFIHLPLPEDTYEKAVAVYIRDAQGNYLARRVYDLTQKTMIGPWEIVADRHNLPSMYFESEVPGMYEVMNADTQKSVICDGKMHIAVSKADMKEKGWYREYLSINEDRSSKTSASLQGRGTSSWNVECKKSYTLKLKKSQNLLGMGSSKSWNLIGNAFDVSLLKNTTFNDIARNAGISYQPQMRNINLYVDGIYQGVYTLTTKVSDGRNRIPLRKGDLLFKMDPPTQDQPLLYSSSTWFEDGLTYPVADLKYPEQAAPEELAQAQAILQDFITTLESKDMAKLDRICDLKSLAKYYWIEEAGMNFDAWQRSAYLYYTKRDGKIHAGPVWDMDLALGSPYTKEGITFDTPEGWKIRCAGWYRALFETEEFRQIAADEYYNGGVRDALLGGVEEFNRNRSELGEDAKMNFTIFGHANRLGKKSIFGDIDDYDTYCDDLMAFYAARIAWIDGQMSAEVYN